MLLKLLTFHCGGLGGMAALRELFFKFSQRRNWGNSLPIRRGGRDRLLTRGLGGFTLAKAQSRKEIVVRLV
jgi:hypothetical protein